MDEAFLLGLHATILKDSVKHRHAGGTYRSKPVVVRWKGNIVYAPPKPEEVPGMMKDLFSELQGYDGTNALQRSCMVLLSLLKVHPFRDANGRTARWTATYMLRRGGFSVQPDWTLEKYVDGHLEEYYNKLNKSTNEDPWPWVAYYSDAVSKAFGAPAQLA